MCWQKTLTYNVFPRCFSNVCRVETEKKYINCCCFYGYNQKQSTSAWYTMKNGNKSNNRVRGRKYSHGTRSPEVAFAPPLDWRVARLAFPNITYVLSHKLQIFPTSSSVLFIMHRNAAIAKLLLTSTFHFLRNVKRSYGQMRLTGIGSSHFYVEAQLWYETKLYTKYAPRYSVPYSFLYLETHL